MKRWVLGVLLVLQFCVLAGVPYQGQGSDGIVRPSCQPTTLGLSSDQMLWAVIMWHSEGMSAPELTIDNIFTWDRFLSSVPDNQPMRFDLIVFKVDGDIQYGLVIEEPHPGGPIPAEYSVDIRNGIAIIIGIPETDVLGYLRPRKISDKSL